MFKKIFLGLLAIACALARSGYAFGKYLADKADASRHALHDTAAV